LKYLDKSPFSANSSSVNNALTSSFNSPNAAGFLFRTFALAIA
jgi:hypothetical protein